MEKGLEVIMDLLLINGMQTFGKSSLRIMSGPMSTREGGCAIQMASLSVRSSFSERSKP